MFRLCYYSGPARVYTMRAKFRQFFLRVTAENIDEITDANLKVTLDRTIDIVAEPVSAY